MILNVVGSIRAFEEWWGGGGRASCGYMGLRGWRRALAVIIHNAKHVNDDTCYYSGIVTLSFHLFKQVLPRREARALGCSITSTAS